MNEEPDKRPRGNPNWKRKEEGENMRDTHEDMDAEAKLAATHAEEERAYVDGREMSDAEFLAALSGNSNMTQVMPTPPEVPGYHVMWESTMPTAQAALRHRLDHMGYTYVRLEECPTYRNHTPRSAGIDGVISYNELVAVKIKKGREQMIAKHFHHDMPLGMEAAIRKKAAELADYDGKKVGLTLSEGTAELGKAPAKTPTFSV